MHSVELLIILLISITSANSGSSDDDDPYVITRGVNEKGLYEPPVIDLTSTNSELSLYIRLCKYQIIDDDDTMYLQMTRYCYCTSEDNDEDCFYPGPTLKMKGDTNPTITVKNALTGSDTNPFQNAYKDLDSTNLHVHGLHVSPLADDILINLSPGDEHIYPYEMDFHYPGTHWYHAHKHGSTTFQVNAGLHGAILMTSEDPLEKALDIYEENVLLFNWQHAIPKRICVNGTRGGSQSTKCTGTDTDLGIVYEPRFLFDEDDFIQGVSMCDIYCKMPRNQLDLSGYVYDFQTDLPIDDRTQFNSNLLLFMVNGQISPIIDDLTAGIYRRLRFVNSLSNWYLQFKFPSECNTHLIATDGVYIDSDEFINYDLSHSSHLNELLLAPGNRNDVMIKCDEPGTYHIYASNNSIQDPEQLKAMRRITDGYRLFSIQVNEREHDLSFYEGTDELPTQYAEKPDGTYIQDLQTEDINPIRQCECNYDTTFNGDACSFHFSLRPSSVNQQPFGYDSSKPYPYYDDALTIIKPELPYELILDNNDDYPNLDVAHVYHQHINPFQVNTTIGNNGFIALPGTWWDTIGNAPKSKDDYIYARTWTRDYEGLVILHCHLLNHEDFGMMGFYDIVDYDDECPTGLTDDSNSDSVSHSDSDSDSLSSDNALQQNEEAHQHQYGSKHETRGAMKHAWAFAIGGFVVIVGILISLICFCNKSRKRVKGLSTVEVDNDSECEDEDAIEMFEGDAMQHTFEENCTLKV